MHSASATTRGASGQHDKTTTTTTTTTVDVDNDHSAGRPQAIQCDSNIICDQNNTLLSSHHHHNDSHITNNGNIINHSKSPEDGTSIMLIATTTTPTPATPPLSTNTRLNIAELLGEFGYYQFSLTILTFIRYICVAMMTNTGPLIAPDVEFYCSPEASIEPLINYPSNATTITTTTNHSLFLLSKCHLPLKNGSQYQCHDWTYNRTLTGQTLTDQFNLVCGHDWLRSAFQSSVSVGVVVASIVFGSYSDEFGRRQTLKICSFISLLAGLMSCWAPTFTVYTISRALCSMSDLGLVGSLYTIIVESFGNKYRGTTCLIVFTGWSMGVMIMPWIVGYYANFRQVMMFTVACHAATLPWILFSVGESIRWLLVRGRIEEAAEEMRRVCRWNWVSVETMAKVEGKFQLSRVKYERLARLRNTSSVGGGDEDNVRIARDDITKRPGKLSGCLQITTRALFGGFFKVKEIFRSSELIITTVVIIWTTFNSELLYMLFIMINSDVGSSVKLNYAIGGIMEVLATLISIVMISKLTRRLSLSATLTTISISMVTLAFTEQNPRTSVWALNFTKFAISTLSSLIYVTVTELFPTSLRQTGMGLAATLGSLGAVIAPFIRTELTDLIGMKSVMLILSLFPLSAALVIPVYLRETHGLDLADDLDDM